MKTLVVALLLAAGNLSAIAGSLYKVESTPFATFIARHPGDILTMIVDEWSDTTDSGSRDHERKSEAEVNLTKFFIPKFNIDDGFVHTAGGGDDPGIAFDSDSKTSASADNKSAHKFETKLEVRLVEEVRPGQFVIRGHRIVNINGKDKKIFVSGIIRQRDITPFNTIRSHQVADAQVQIVGEVGGKDVAEGFLNKVFNFIF